MNQNLYPLPFPNECPKEYIRLDNEPKFIASRHLCLEQPRSIYLLEDLGYSEEETTHCESFFGYCTAFRILSDEGVIAMKNICDRIYKNRNESTGTGANRLGSYARGAADESCGRALRGRVKRDGRIYRMSMVRSMAPRSPFSRRCCVI